MISKFRNSR